MQTLMRQTSDAVSEDPARFNASGQIASSPAQRTPSRSWAWLRLITCAALLPNLVTLAAFASFAAFFRGWINIEFILLVALYAVTRNRCVLFLTIPIELVLDLFEPVARVYYFKAGDAIESLSYLSMIPSGTVAVYAVVVIAYIASVLCAVFVLVPRACRLSPAAITLAAAATSGVLFTSDYYAGRYQALGADLRRSQVNLVRTPALSAGYRILTTKRFRTNQTQPTVIDAASRQFLKAEQTALLATRTNLVVILLESWGQIDNEAATVELGRPYQTEALKSRYKVDTGTVPFWGPTVYGETRELCGQAFANGIASASTQDLQSCLPHLFASHGYATVGIHGFYPQVYDRVHWYSRIGFSTTLFKPDFDRLGMRTCGGGLAGICDADILQWITKRIKQSTLETPVFIHWATLDSHLPVLNIIDRQQQQYCRSVSPLLEDQTLCNWFTLVARVHQNVSRLAMDDALPPTAFVIAGDHAPPFSATNRRMAFSQKTVPYVLLTPRKLDAFGSAKGGFALKLRTGGATR